MTRHSKRNERHCQKMQLRKVDFVFSVLGAIVAAIAFATLTPLNATHSASVLLGSLIVYLPFCLAGELLLGLPIFLAMLKMNMVRWWIWLPLSFVLGIALGVFIGGVPGRDVGTFIATVSVSFVSAVAFRLTLVMSKKIGSSSD